MILVGDDDFVTNLKTICECFGENINVLGGGRVEMDFFS
jgi:hypothetical protein